MNLSKWKTLFTEGLTPVVKSTSRPRWQRMQQQFVFYYQSPIHNDHFILSFAFSFDREDERYSFGLAQPYSLSRYNLYMGTINMSSWAVERWDPLTAHIDVCSMQTSIWAALLKMIKKIIIIENQNIHIFYVLGNWIPVYLARIFHSWC